MQEQVIKVYHVEDGKAVHVANVKNSLYGGQHEALEYAYFRSQNIQGSWSKGPEISWAGELVANEDYSPDIEVVAPLKVSESGVVYGFRSSSVGDIFVLEGMIFVCASSGFKQYVGELDKLPEGII